MAPYIGLEQERIDVAVDSWKRRCLLDDGSLLFPDNDRQVECHAVGR